MQRHGLAFCLGLLVSGVAAAQPPADSERYPPAPDLPGIVVGQANGGKPIGKTMLAAPKVVSVQAAEPGPTPRSADTDPVPGSSISATTEPVDSAPVKPEVPVAATSSPTKVKGCKSGCCTGECLTRITDWLLFRSHARQQGCYPSPYRPPLQAWFPCDATGACGSCASGKLAVVAPTVVAPPPESPLPPPAPIIPTPKVSSESSSLPRPAPALVAGPDSELPGSFRVDTGLRFSPGAAPMANPTTQIEKVSNWRPK
jgi:hypothetical protein